MAATMDSTMTASDAESCRSCWPGIFTEPWKAARRYFIIVALGCDIFARSNTIFFRESYLGYLSIILVFPFLAYALFRRFLPEHWALALILLFIAVPIGALFGTTSVQYARWASRGFADPMAYILFIAGLLTLINANWVSRGHFTTGFLGRSAARARNFHEANRCAWRCGLADGRWCGRALHGQWARVAGLCIGVLPAFSMTLHNWLYGHVFV